MYQRNFLVILLVLLVSACSSSPLRLTQTDIDELHERGYTELPTAKSSAGGFILFNIIPIRIASCELRARDAILMKSGGDDIIDPQISSAYTWTPIGSIHRIKLTATPIVLGKKTWLKKRKEL